MPESTAAAPVAASAASTPAADAAPAVDAAEPAAASATPEVAAPKKYKVKVDGAEQEVDEDELLRGYQIRKASDKRFQEGAEAKKAADARYEEVDKVLRLALDSPAEFARRMKSVDPKFDEARFAEDILLPLVQQQIDADQEAQMSPEQKEQLALKRRLSEYEAKEKADVAAKQRAEADQKAAAHKTQVEKTMEDFGQKLVQALEKTKLPKTDETALELLALAEEAYKRGLDIDPAYLAKDLEARKAAEVNSLRNPDMLDPAFKREIMLMAKGDPEIREMIRKEMVAEFKEKNPLIPAAQPNRTDRVVSKDQPERKRKSTYGSVMKDLQLMAHATKK